MSVMKYKDPVTGAWVSVPALKVIEVYEGGGSSTVGVPSDIVNEANRVASSIQTKIATNSVNFIAISDMHEMGDSDNTNANLVKQYRRANMNAGQGARLIAEKISPDFFANLGDLAWGSSSTTLHDWAQSVRNARGYTAGLEPLTECFYTAGNHDVDYADGYHDKNLVAGLIGTYRYVDLTKKKVRVICLNTADTTDGTNSTERISGEQLQWFANALDISAKSDAAKWSIIVLSHHPLDWGNIKPAANCLAAYINGTAYSATHDGMSISKDFTGKNKATFVANFHGHTHCFKVANISGTEALRVAIPNACYSRTNEYGESGNAEFGETASYEKTDDGTGKNTAFCVVSVDLNKRVIYADCFGAGYDRVVSYGDEVITTYSITNNLVNATNSNGTATIVSGEKYTATITANNNFELQTITVTMGGVDITAIAVSGNKITIAEVTGDIVIKAVAKYTVTYDVTNLVLTSEALDSTAVYNGVGYKNGVYVSDASDGMAAGCVSTGYIKYTWSPDNSIYIRGATLDTADDHVRVYGFNSKGSVNNSVGYTSGTRINERFDVETLGNQYYKLTPIDKNTSITYIRLSLVGTGENLIVTINEPIDNGSGGNEGGGTTGEYTNLVPLSTSDGTNIFNSPLGYRNGVYLSSSTDNEYSTDAACVSTGNMVLTDGVAAIYIKGATWDASNSHVRMMFGTLIGGLSYTFYANGGGDQPVSDFFNFETLGDNYYRFKLTSKGKNYLYGKYYRISLVGTGENLIVTHDEPIE